MPTEKGNQPKKTLDLSNTASASVANTEASLGELHSQISTAGAVSGARPVDKTLTRETPTNDHNLPGVGEKPDAVLREEETLAFWKKNRIFEKSLELRKKGPSYAKASEGTGKTFVFYEGPPTANAAPGFHHVESRAFKDIIPRYKSMRGYNAPRRAGWDTHGLPVEIQVEKALGFKTKHDIENFGIGPFNEKCREAVWANVSDWRELTERIAFWVDLERPYVTYERSYMETLWWIIAEWWKKGFLYQDFKVLPWCTRCGTGLSSHEVALGYKSVVDTSVYIRFKIQSQDPKWKSVAFLSWTTTPWTLPGNVALAVSLTMQYVRVPDPEKKGSWVVVGQDSLAFLIKRGVVPKDTRPSTAFSGKDLIGLSYIPLFDVPGLAATPSYQVYPADFVTAEDGTGVVHTAVMYGDDDYKLGKKIGLPAMHTVTDSGHFIPSLGGGLGGKYVKARETEALLLQLLQRMGALFREEAYEHDYPFCWRCDTPILYYARTSWWVKVNAVRKDLLKNNETIDWVPGHLKKGRFGEWLKEEKDWAFSRERYWGTTLPLWRCQACGDTIAISSIEELADRALNSGNRYIVMRHGEAESNVAGFVSSWPETRPNTLTAKGKSEVAAAAAALKLHQVDLIYASDLLRTKESADAIAEALGIKDVRTDPRLRELDTGSYNGRPAKEYRGFFKTVREKLESSVPGGESLFQVRARMSDFYRFLEGEHRGKTILIVTHADPAWMISTVLRGLSDSAVEVEWKHPVGEYLTPGMYQIHESRTYPLNPKGEVDLHRPYIDQVKIRCSCGGVKTRIPEVADVWFDSGAMPFASLHYPFEHREEIEKKRFFPADYISEAIDQTRGWFYTLLAVSTLLGKSAPFKHVISLGHVLDKNGQKMSKSKGNIVSPWAMIDRYGADAIRWYFYTVNAPGDTKKFDEKDLAGKARGFLNTLWNSYLLFATYAKNRVSLKSASKRLVDQWILARLQTTTKLVTSALDSYDIVTAARTIESFVVDDFSNWYLRRSRRRFQRPESRRDKDDVMQTTAVVLLQVAELSAPFIPFMSESLYQGLKDFVALDEASVHLRSWPELLKKSQNLRLEVAMDEARKASAEALRARAEAGVKVRQPLALLTLSKKSPLKRFGELQKLVIGEVNVKNLDFAPKLPKGKSVMLDTIITEELRREGIARELVRHIQELRRGLDLKPQQFIQVLVSGPERLTSIVKKWEKQIRRDVGAKTVRIAKKVRGQSIEEIPFGKEKILVGIRRA